MLGPEEFGLYVAVQAAALILMPLVSLRIETLVVVCKTDSELSELSTALTSLASIFLLISAALALG